MKLKEECYPCMKRALVKLADKVAVNEDMRKAIIGYGMERIHIDARGRTAPVITAEIYNYAKVVSGQEDPYFAEKEAFNEIAKALVEELGLERTVKNSANPLETAVRLSIAGNIIDYSAGYDVEESGVRASVERSLKTDLYGMDLEAFAKDIQNAKRIMVVADNAGEIVFDKLLVDRLPAGKVVYAVKSGAIVNDATMKDAYESGMCDLAPVVENGTAIQGTVLDQCSPDYRRLFDTCDLIISKGQANFETLDTCSDKAIYFLLRAKCKAVADEIGCEQGAYVFMRKS